MEIELFAHKAFITKATDEEISAAKAVGKVILYRREGRRKVYQETIHLFNDEDNSIPAPYFWRFSEKMDKLGIDIDLFDERTYPASRLSIRKSFSDPMYPDQETVLERASRHPTGVISKMTGGGKTRSIYELINQKRVRTLVIVPTRSIQDGIYHGAKEHLKGLKVSKKVEKKSWETVSSWKKSSYKPKVIDWSDTGEDEEEIMTPEEEYLHDKGFATVRGKIRKVRRASDVPEKEEGSWPDLLVLCFQSLENLPMSYVESVEQIIVDEGDTASCASIRETLELFENAVYRYFFTATFWRSTEEETELLVAAAGNQILFEETPHDTMEKGVTLRPDYRQISSPYPTSPDGKTSDWLKDVKGIDNVIKRCVVGNTARNQLIIDETYNFYHDKRNTIIFISEEAHAFILQKRFEDRGIKAFVYSSSLNTKERKDIEIMASDTDRDDGLIIIATSALRRGTDTVNIDTIVLADVRKSPTNLFQSIGRGTRKGMRDDLIVLDFKDWFHDTTSRWSYERRKAYKEYYETEESFTFKKFKKAKIDLEYLG